MEKSFFKDKRQKAKVVRLELDASFFFELAVRSLDRHQYKKALKYFRLSVEKEPDNPVNYCNLAGLLSELGHFEESNDVLQQVLDQVDHTMHECRFYMANNYASMDDFEQAEDCLLDYLNHDPHGEYAEDAEEMLYMVSFELGRSPEEQEKAVLPPHVLEHDQASKYLEEGKFVQAAEILKTLKKKHPEYLPAHNNLSLAYFYMGKLDQAYATVHEVLQHEPTNLHAQCNLALFTNVSNTTKVSQNMVNRLKKLVPLNPELLYKLATTMGILEEDQTAYQLFLRFFRFENPTEPSMYHYIAVAAWNTGRYQQARHYWQKGAGLDPDSEVFRYYLEQSEHWNMQDPHFQSLSYYYYIPFQESLTLISEQESHSFPMNPLLNDSIHWALIRGNNTSRIQVIQMMEWLNNDESERLLRRFLLQPDEENELKKVVLLILRQMDGLPPFMIWFKGELLELSLDDDEAEVNTHFEIWKQILKRVLSGMCAYTNKQQIHAKWLWAEYIRIHGTSLPPVRKVEAWAAALEYVVAKYDHVRLTQVEVAKKYQVSPSTVSRHISELAPLMTIYQK